MANTFTKISTQTVGAGGSVGITFSNIPQTYTDLKVMISARGATGNFTDVLPLTINGNFNLSARWIDGYNNAASSASATSAANYGVYVREPASTATANIFGNAEIYIPNYTGSTFKSFTMDIVSPNASSTNYFNQLYAGLYPSTNAITSIGFLISNGAIVQNSTFTLYGINKNA
jgi:hypothetical protein